MLELIYKLSIWAGFHSPVRKAIQFYVGAKDLEDETFLNTILVYILSSIIERWE